MNAFSNDDFREEFVNYKFSILRPVAGLRALKRSLRRSQAKSCACGSTDGVVDGECTPCSLRIW